MSKFEFWKKSAKLWQNAASDVAQGVWSSHNAQLNRVKLERPDFSGLIGAAHTVIMAVKKAYNQENELLACRPSPEVMIQIFMPGQATMCYG